MLLAVANMNSKALLQKQRYQVNETPHTLAELDFDDFFPKRTALIHFPGDFPIVQRLIRKAEEPSPCIVPKKIKRN